MPSDPLRSGPLVAWGGAWLAGEAALEESVARIRGGDDASVVSGLAAEDLNIERALPRLRADGVSRLRLVLPAPGDPTGLPGPGPFTATALAAGEGVLAVCADGTAIGLVPAVTVHGTSVEGTSTTVCWTAYRLPPLAPWPGPFLAEVEQDLRRGLLEVAAALRELDVARWRPELADALHDLRARARRGVGEDELPAAFPPRARELLARSRQLDGVLLLAGQDSGGAVDSRETAAREAHLREVARLVRRARVAAYNALADGSP